MTKKKQNTSTPAKPPVVTHRIIKKLIDIIDLYPDIIEYKEVLICDTCLKLGTVIVYVRPNYATVCSGTCSVTLREEDGLADLIYAVKKHSENRLLRSIDGALNAPCPCADRVEYVEEPQHRRRWFN